MSRVTDLDEAIKAAGVPIDGVARLNNGTVRIDFAAEATDEQRTQAQAIAAGWDWTPIPANVALRAAATKLLASQQHEVSPLMRAVLLTLLDELNAHAEKINAILTAVDGAANLAGLKTAIAAIADHPARTAAQMRTAILGKIDAGDADS
jgi:hypothetical protein